MAIYRKKDIDKRLDGLERYYLGLREAIEGRATSSFMASTLQVSEEELAEKYRTVDFDEVLLRLEHFKAEVTAVKALKSHAVKPPRV